ncbi:MAG: LysR family transcriptional regulator [Muribaculaceae bacterium]|nr:LysR family transcriptional regulator [Muribaculaceae bacterium]
MELRQLKYFVKVAETLNFSEAAKALFVTQSTLSQQIKQLEGELRVQLFTRSSHNVDLTEAGSELLPYARQTIIDADQCTARICDLNNLSAGTLNIGVTYSFSPILTETLVTFMKSYPHIKLNIIYRPMAELMDILRRREVDFVLAFKPSEKIEGVESHIIFQNCLSVVVSSYHPLASRDRITLDELATYDLALPTPGLQARNAFDRICGDRSRYRIRIELNEVNILLTLIRSTMLVSVLAEATTHNEKGVKAIPLAIPDNEMAGCVHILKDSYRKRSMQEFVRMLSESIAVRDRQNAWI